MTPRSPIRAVGILETTDAGRAAVSVEAAIATGTVFVESAQTEVGLRSQDRSIRSIFDRR